MNTTPSGKTLYIAVSDNHAVRIKAYSKKKAIVRAAIIFASSVRGWQPEHGGLVEKAHTKEMRQYLSEHPDIEWLEGGAPVDG